jgi:CNT family concentrative nucleoside transporter
MAAQNLLSLLGIPAFLLLAWVCSGVHKRINWRLLSWGIGLQMLVGLFVFRSPFGQQVFTAINNAFVRVIEAANAGPEFVLGPLALSPGNEGSLGFILITQALPLIIVFSGLISLLYHAGLMQWIIKLFARIFSRLMGISGAESLSSASNIFVGIESTLTVKPHLQKMTDSELCAVLTVCMATVASNVIAAYHMILSVEFPSITGHLVSASILSAPAALVISKLILPETGVPETLGRNIQPYYEKEKNLFCAIITGANNGVQLLIGIASLLIAVVGLLYIFNMLLAGIGSLTGMDTPLTLERILGTLFRPVVWLMGIPWEECGTAGQLIGQRLILTEVPGYIGLKDAIASQAISPRTAVITAYALCGFAHIPSMAIFVGGVAALVPDRRSDLARIAPRALLAANLACLMTGCIAGIFSADSSVLLGLQ